ncbi:MAG TPA: hypothetical protein DG048_24255 [Pseudoalteromonas sp.]|nr:hypothetical protein [Pseudoalteromonas sp.]|tara:strand:- start:139 stop:1791 length:1653 start_codon:yes stop_codon:yes gene_type:complete
MHRLFNNTEKSQIRHGLTHKFEPIQPYLFLGFIEYSGASIVIDIGANVGFYTLLSSMGDSVKRIISFEPEEQAYNELIENISINGLSKLVEPVLKLVSDTNQTLGFGVHSALSGINGVLDSSIHDKTLFQEIRDLDSVTLDSYFNYIDTTLAVKIDVEGHELQVLMGAEKLLKRNPTVIQIEHYVGNGIDQLLSSMGYFRIHSAGHDYYYSNIANFQCAEFVNRAISHAHALMIDHSTGSLQSENLLSQSLTLSFEIKDKKLNGSARLKSDMFFDGPLEYAFYLIKNGEKLNTQWYSTEAVCEFDLPEECTGYSLKGFVREVNNPKKMTSSEILVSGHEVEHGARSSSPDSYNSPLINAEGIRSPVSCHYELDFESLLVNLPTLKGNSIILMGASRLKRETEALLSSHFSKVVSISYKNPFQEIQFTPAGKYEHISASSQVELFDIIRRVKSIDKEQNCFVILDSLFDTLPFSEPLIKKLTEQLDTTDVLACQALTDKSFRDLLGQYSEHLILIPAKSTIEKKRSTMYEKIDTGKQSEFSSVIGKLNFKL